MPWSRGRMTVPQHIQRAGFTSQSWSWKEGDPQSHPHCGCACKALNRRHSRCGSRVRVRMGRTHSGLSDFQAPSQHSIMNLTWFDGECPWPSLLLSRAFVGFWCELNVHSVRSPLRLPKHSSPFKIALVICKWGRRSGKKYSCLLPSVFSLLNYPVP